MPTQLEYNLSKQTVRLNRIKINLLDYNFNNVGELTGDLVETPSFTIDSNSDIRRTCSVVITPTDSSFDIKMGNKIWLDKYMQIYISQESVQTREVEYTNMGIYLINNPQRMYSATENTLTIQGVDLMAKLTGMRNGNLRGLPYIIPQGSNVREAIIATLEECGFTKYIVEECPIDVPNDINIEIGGTAFQILSALRDILPMNQMYFDVDGVFHYEPIPSGVNEQVMVDDDIWEVNLIDYQKNTSFEDLKNSIEVFGKTHDVKNYGGDAKINKKNNTYYITLEGVRDIRKGMKIGFRTDVDLGENKRLCVITNKSEVDDYGVVTTETEITTGRIRTEKGLVPTFKDEPTYYVVKYTYAEDNWKFIKTKKKNNPKVATIADDTYIINDKDVILYEHGMTYTFKTPSQGCDTIYRPRFQINTFKSIEIDNTVKLQNDTVYTLQLNLASENAKQRYYQFMGELTPYAKIQETNPDSPFYVDGSIGEIRIVLSGGDYDNIYTSDLAMQRAKWELYQRCRLIDNVTINCIPIYWLDVNWLVNLTLPNKYGEETTEQYIIKSINIGAGVGATQSITLMKYYPYYETEVESNETIEISEEDAKDWSVKTEKGKIDIDKLIEEES